MSAPAWPELDNAKAAQAEAATPGVSAWVAANAGSGKTKVLIDRVARLLLRGAKPASILCVTYTKAAASEMQDRLFRVLGGWCVMEAPALRAQLAALEARDTFTDEEVARARTLFAQALETPGGLRIETIHAFCGRVLRRFPLEAGIAPGFHELDDTDSGDLWQEAIRALGAIILSGGDEKLTDAARCVVEGGAGAGLGVLRQLDSRRGEVSDFIARNGGIDDAVERLREILGASEETPAGILEHVMGRDLPRAQLIPIAAAIPATAKSDVELIDRIDIAVSEAPAAERFAAYSRLVFTASGDARKSNPYTVAAAKLSPTVVRLFQVKDIPQGEEIIRILNAAEEIRIATIFERSAALLRLANAVLADFARRKAARAGLDFDDLIDVTARLLSPAHRDAAEWVLWKLDGGIAHILLDEAQDTAPEQWDILDSLTADVFAGQGVERSDPRTVFVVGDQKQSIYSFQGADPEEFIRQGRSFRRRAEGVIPYRTPHLAMSWRSVPEVLSFVDETFDPAHFSDGAPFSVQAPDEADVMRHDAQRRAHAGSVELWPLEPPTKAEDPDPWHAPVDQQEQGSPRAHLATRIAQWVRAEIDRGAAVWDKGAQRPARPGDFLILVKRRTGGLFDAILQSLKQANLPVAGADRLLLLESLAVQDLLNLVRFALCPEEDLVLAEIIKGPFGAYAGKDGVAWLDDDHLFALANGRTGAPLWSRLAASADPRHAPLRDFLNSLLARRHLPPYEYLACAMERGPGLPLPGWELVLRRFGDPAREPVAALLDRAASFDASSPPSLELFLAAIERHGGEVKRELSGPQDEVRVMTVHGAKGLEAPIVILPDTTSDVRKDTSGLFFAEDGAPVWTGPKGNDTPATALLRADSDARALREHRRLLYVALTRAQDRLVVCGAWAGSVNGAGRPGDSWYALCQSAMNRLFESARAVEDAETIRRLGAPPPSIVAHSTISTTITAPPWMRQPAPAEKQARRILSPSALGPAEPPVMTPFGEGRENRLRRGRLIHALFQNLPDIAPASRGEAAAAFLARQPGLTDAQRKEMLNAAFGVIEDKRFAALFAPGGRAEAPVIGRWGPDIVNGRIDRLVVTPAEVLIVDFKTDRPAPPSVADVGAAYILQMAAYREILRQTWPGRSVRCLLAWTDGPELMEIPGAMLDRALESAGKSAR